MKRKAALAALLCLAGAGAFAFGIGAQGATNVAWGGKTGVEATFAFERIPLVLGLGIPCFSPLAIGVSADYRIANPRIAGGASWSIDWHIGAGVFADFFVPDGGFYFGLGLRAPVGVSFFFAGRMFEIYLQAAPGLEYRFGAGGGAALCMPLGYGLRFWHRRR